MSPQEKAKELVDKYYDQVEDNIRFPDGEKNHDGAISSAKDCAIIAIDEILKNTDILRYVSMGNRFPSETLISDEQYWKQVKEEIENL